MTNLRICLLLTGRAASDCINSMGGGRQCHEYWSALNWEAQRRKPGCGTAAKRQWHEEGIVGQRCETRRCGDHPLSGEQW